MQKRAERQQPCLIPLSKVKNSEDLPLFVTQLSIWVYSIFTFESQFELLDLFAKSFDSRLKCLQ